MKFNFLIVIFLFININMYAPAPPPPNGGVAPGCWPPPCVPIDGGISFLMVAGAMYGGRKLLSNKNKPN